MKKFIILLLSIFLAMSLAACGNKTDSRDSSEKTEIKDAKELLTTVWNSYEEDEKFAIAGGDMTEENMTEDAPGTFGITDADELHMKVEVAHFQFEHLAAPHPGEESQQEHVGHVAHGPFFEHGQKALGLLRL